MTFKSLLFAGTVCVIGLSSAVADPGNGRGKGKGKKPQAETSSTFDGAVRNYTRLGDYERELVRDYYRDNSNCPPGLAKKNNGCLPPGIAKKHYKIGSPIFDGADVYPLPRELSRRLPVLPSGYDYRLIDGDLGVVELSTLVVLDAIGLF